MICIDGEEKTGFGGGRGSIGLHWADWWVHWLGVVRRGGRASGRGVGPMGRTGLYGDRCAEQKGMNWLRYELGILFIYLCLLYTAPGEREIGLS